MTDPSRREVIARLGAVGLWTAPIVRSVHLTGQVGTPPPRRTEEEPPPLVAYTPVGPESPEKKSGGTLPFTGDNVARDAAIGASLLAAGTLAQLRRRDPEPRRD